MKALFVHDHIFYRVDEDIYSPGGLPTYAWERYLNNVDSLTVVSRGKEITDTNGLVLSSKDRVHFDLLFQVAGGLDYYKYKSQIVQKLETHIRQVDFVIIRVPSTIGYFAYTICKKMNKPYVTEVVGCAWDSTWNYGSFLVKAQAPLGYLRMKKMVSQSIAATYVTKYFLQKRYPTRAKLTIHASNVQLSPFPDKILENRLQKIEKSSTVDTIKLGLIGNLEVQYKGFDVAAKALKIVKENLPSKHFVLYLVGGGNPKYVKQLFASFGLSENLEVVGRLQSGNPILEFLDNIDIYIHPSKQEGLPRSVIEAMSRACPILASSVAGIPELIEKPYLHKPGDYKQLAAQIIDVFQSKSMIKAMAEYNFNNAKDYTSDILSERRNQFFNNVVNLVRNEKKN
jgi:glycosyltransferase involved in cell wall biosynthesis